MTVRTVKERELPAARRRVRPVWRASSTPSTSCAADLRERLGRVKKVEQLYAARDKALEALVEAADVPAPEGVVKRRGRAAASSRWSTSSSGWAPSLEDYLASEGKTEEDFDAELADGGRRRRQDPAAAGRVRRRSEEIEVTDDEFGHEIVHRAAAGRHVARSSTTTSWSGPARRACVFADVRRGKALAAVLERVVDHGHRRRPRSRWTSCRPTTTRPRPRDTTTRS